MALACTTEELVARFRQSNSDSGGDSRMARMTVIEELTDERLRLRCQVDAHGLRPGGTVMGPLLMAFVDSAGWLTTVAHHGVDTDAVTTDLSMQFLRPLPVGEVVVDARPLRVGARTVVAVDLRQYAGGPVAAHAVVTFAPLRAGVPLRAADAPPRDGQAPEGQHS